MNARMERLEHLLELGGIKKDVTLLVLSGAAVLASLLDFRPLPFDMAWAAIVLCGVPIILEALIGLVTAFDIKADVLVSLALIASVCIGEYFAAGEVAFIMQLGALLEELTVAKARAGIEKLVHLTPQTARRLTAEGEEIVAAEAVRVGEHLRVLPGETVPVDGVILSGQTSVNQAVMTGESLPVDKGIGDEVSSGTVNQFGAFEMRATKVGEDSSIQRMIRLVQSADAGKAKIVGIADRWATWIVIIAVTAAVLTWLISGEIIRAYAASVNLIRNRKIHGQFLVDISLAVNIIALRIPYAHIVSVHAVGLAALDIFHVIKVGAVVYLVFSESIPEPIADNYLLNTSVRSGKNVHGLILNGFIRLFSRRCRS